MKNIKRLISLLLCFVLIFSLAGCNKSGNNGSSGDDSCSGNDRRGD